jgi:hypothetical protein
MLNLGIVIVAIGIFGLLIVRPSRSSRSVQHRRMGAILLVSTILGSLLMIGTAWAAIVPTVPLGTAGNYSVLAGTEVTNVGNSVLNLSLGVSPGTSITGFPPGIVNPPATIDNAGAAQAQLDLTAAYTNAAGRPLNATTAADLAGLTLVGGVYAASSNGALLLTGNLTLDGENNPDSVFIFKTDSTLTTSSASSVSLINGAQQCNVFWQIGSTAILGSGSTFVGNILALTSITMGDGVTVQGRALARNAEVTLINDTFNQPTCAQAPPASTTSTTATGGGTSTSTTAGLPLTGISVDNTLLIAFVALALGAVVVRLSRPQGAKIQKD